MNTSGIKKLKNQNKLQSENISVMKVGKDHVIGMSHIYTQSCNYSLLCTSLLGGYILCIPMEDLNNIIHNDRKLQQEMKDYAVQE